ncbi:MAG: hypothetical protein AB8F34_05715 [Akkermansiaceae bacterium]
MSQNQNSHPQPDHDFPDPPEGLEIIELTANRNFRIREFVSWPIKGGIAFILLIGILLLIAPITQGSIVEDFLNTKFGDVPLIASQAIRGVLVAAVAYLLFQIMKLLFGMTEVRGTMNAISSYHRLFGIPVTRSMSKIEFKSVELKYYRGRSTDNSAAESRYPGDWKIRLIGANGSLKIYETGSHKEAEWLAQFVAQWYGLEVEHKGDKRKISW